MRDNSQRLLNTLLSYGGITRHCSAFVPLTLGHPVKTPPVTWPNLQYQVSLVHYCFGIRKLSISVKLHLFHACCCTIYCYPLWINFNKGTYFKAKVAYYNMHKRILGYQRWDSVSSRFVSNAIDTFYVLMHKNIYDFKMYSQHK